MKRVAMLACAAGLAMCGVAQGQLQRPVVLMAGPGAPAVGGWTDLLKVTDRRELEVEYRVEAWISARGGENVKEWEVVGEGFEDVNLGEAAPNGTWSAKRVLFVAPMVLRSATQQADGHNAALTLTLDGTPVEIQEVWMKSPDGMESLRGALVRVPKGQEVAIDPNCCCAAFQMNARMKYTTMNQDVELNAAEAAQATWPTSWPEEAAGALDAVVFMDSAIDPNTKLVRAIDVEALDEFAHQMASARGIGEVTMTPPLQVIKGIAEEVTKRVKREGTAVLLSARMELAMNRASASDPLGGFPSEEKGTMDGFDVRDALTVLRGGAGNDAERATVLAAVYRRLGVPARVVVGAVGVNIEDGENVKRNVAVPVKVRDGRRLRPQVLQQAQAASTFLELVGPPEFRFWVEVAMWNERKGIAWVPVEFQRGNQPIRVGEIEGASGIAVLATNWWPSSTIRVGWAPKGKAIPSGKGDQGPKAVLGADGKWRLVTDDIKDIEAIGRGPLFCNGLSLPAGLWGYAVQGMPTACYHQEIGFVVREKGSINTSKKP